jgi:hypothetical protein
MLIDIATASPTIKVEQTKAAELLKIRVSEEEITSSLIYIAGFNKGNTQRITTFHLLIVSVYI